MGSAKIGQVFAQSNDVLMSDVGDLKVLMSMDNGRFVELNETGRVIWNLLDGKRSLSQIAEELDGIYAVQQEKCEAQVLRFVDSLRDQSLVELTD